MKRRIGTQQGVALPLTLMVSMLMIVLLTVLLSQVVNNRHSSMAELQMAKAQYAAESGIARMQQHLQAEPNRRKPLRTAINGMEAITTVIEEDDRGIDLRSVAKGKGVQQTIHVTLDPDTMNIRQWKR
jgi:Tfp pilus assembly protein PilV